MNETYSEERNVWTPEPDSEGLDKYELANLVEWATGPLYQRGGLADTLERVDSEAFNDPKARELWPKINKRALARRQCTTTSRYLTLLSILMHSPERIKPGALPQRYEQYFVEIVNAGGYISVTNEHLAKPESNSALMPWCLTGGNGGGALVIPRLVRPHYTEIGRKKKGFGTNGSVIDAVNGARPIPWEIYNRVSRSNQSQRAHSCIGALSEELWEIWMDRGQKSEDFPFVVICTFYKDRNLMPVTELVGPGAKFYNMWMDWYFIRDAEIEPGEAV